MKDIKIEKLVEWLGREGAIAGLETSHVTVSQLSELASRCGLAVDWQSKRSEIIVDLVNGSVCKIDKTAEELMEMSHSDLKNYFSDRKVSRPELLKLLMDLDICPMPGGRGSLMDFAAREISDIGMYQRVARGTPRA
ncbi:MAG: hypothetical protein OXF73_14020 [Gammaproteobacteria bacterium]|nr:hypothetical protein [Gammaproteobacteria bacterium]